MELTQTPTQKNKVRRGFKQISIETPTSYRSSLLEYYFSSKSLQILSPYENYYLDFLIGELIILNKIPAFERDKIRRDLMYKFTGDYLMKRDDMIKKLKEFIKLPSYNNYVVNVHRGIKTVDERFTLESLEEYRKSLSNKFFELAYGRFAAGREKQKTKQKKTKKQNRKKQNRKKRYTKQRYTNKKKK